MSTLAARPRSVKSSATGGTARRLSGGVGAGMVQFHVQGSPPKGQGLGFSASKQIEALRAGLPFQELEDLRTSLAIPMERLAPLLGISKSTLQRRKEAGRLDSAESDHVVRFARLMGKAVEALESEDTARLWLASPQHGLGGAVPLDYAGTEVGAREVEDLLGRIDAGVYS